MSFALKHQIAQLYLYLVPLAGTALAFGVGHVHYTYYLPVWLLNGALMFAACRQLGLKGVQQLQPGKRKLLWAGFFFILPWMFISLFAGLGPPPETIDGWAATAKEQQLRYSILMVVGVLEAIAFTILYDVLSDKEESLIARVGWICMMIATPLFLLNMSYWASYLPQLFQQLHANNEKSLPQWTLPLRQLFAYLSVAEVTLTYLAILVFAFALQQTKMLNSFACRVYIFLTTAAAIIMMLSVFLPDALRIPSFVLSIPAFPFLIPYIMGIQLLKISGRE